MLKKTNIIWNYFQKYCLPPLCSNCNKRVGYLCQTCTKQLTFTINHSRIANCNHYYFSNYTPLLKTIIKAIKYDNYKQALRPIYNHLNQNPRIQSLLKQYDIWIPIPYHPNKLYQRGYNIIETMFKPIFDQNNVPIQYNLERKKNTNPLAKLSKINRKKTLKNAFKIKQKQKKNKKNLKIALVDDIVTTQTSMKECINILQESYSIDKLDCISLIKA